MERDELDSVLRQNDAGGERGGRGAVESPVQPVNDDENTPPDLLPEFCYYPDEGCELAQSCLGCPFPVCIDDEPRGKHRLFIRRRAFQIARLRIVEQKTVNEIAAMFGVSTRTVHRTLKTVAGRGHRKREPGNQE